MKKRFGSHNKIENFVPLSGIFLAPILITPWFSFDPINLPRLALIAVLGGYSLALLIWNLFSKSYSKPFEILLIALIIFGFLVTWLLGEASLVQQLYGVQGRNLGLLTSLGLVSILAISSLSNLYKNDSKFIRLIYITGLANLLYAFVQSLGLDPINWQNAYGPVVGMLGNPNFLSAFLGLFSTFLFSRLFYANNTSNLISLLNFGLLISCLILLGETDSIQGYFVTLIGCATVIYLRFKEKISTKFKIFLALITLTSTLVTFAAMLGAISVLDRFEQSTLILRLYFWQVAISMLRERPFTGFGFDSYGDWYPKFRDQGIVDLYSLGLTSNSPHNIFLDVASSSGALVFVLYIILYMWIFYKAIKHLTSGPVDWFFTFTFASWLGYVAQGFISVNSLALAIIGNCLGGLLLSRCISNPGIDNRLSKSKNFSDVARSKILSSFLGLVVGFAISFPALYNDYKFRAALGQSNGQELIEVAQAWPPNEVHMLIVARVLYSNGFGEVARDITDRVIDLNPRFIAAYKTLIERDKLTNAEVESFRLILKDLDPLDPQFKN